MGLNRKPTQKELNVIEYLIKKAHLSLPDNWRDQLRVEEMEDGNMGSLKLFPNESIIGDRMVGNCVSEFQFTDKDGVEVIVSLFLDASGQLYELDVWKTDYNPLIEFPEELH